MNYNVDRPDWAADARCRNVPNNVFFPDSGENYAKARAVCARCPVKDACLDWQLEHEKGQALCCRHGMYGGQTPRERWGYRKRTGTCEVCGDVFKLGRPNQRLCGDKGCWNLHRAEYMQTWRETA